MGKITKRAVDALQSVSGRDVFIWDSELRGFGNQPTFCIRSTFCEDRVSVSSLLWAGSSSFSEQAR